MYYSSSNNKLILIHRDETTFAQLMTMFVCNTGVRSGPKQLAACNLKVVADYDSLHQS